MSSTAIEQIFEALEQAKADFRDGYSGKKKVSATRARKALQDVRALAQEARKELLAISKGETEPVSVNIE